MQIGPFTIARTKALNLAPVPNTGSSWGWPFIGESYAGAWQQNVQVRVDDVLTHPTAWSCITLIASDIAKMAVGLVKPENGIWVEVDVPAYSPVLRKPNHFQHRIKFYQQWIISKLTQGNTYALKARDNRNVTTAMYILDPHRVRPLVAPDGGVYYELKRDDLSGQPQEQLVVPASEVIHDIHIPLYHPLVGVSPIHASGVAAYQGLKIQNNSANLFANGSNPGGVLTAPGAIGDATAARLKAYWDANFTGANVGKVAILGDGLKFEKMTMTAVDSDMIKQLNWSDERICSTFHVPPHMVGVGPTPTYNNIEALVQMYYSQCLQVLIEEIEILLDEGLGLLPSYGSEFDLDNLLRMDSATMMATIKEGVGAGVVKPNEGRRSLNLPPVEGGDTPYLQQQYWPLSQLAGRSIPQIPAAPSAATMLTEPRVEDVDAKAFAHTRSMDLQAKTMAFAEDAWSGEAA